MLFNSHLFLFGFLPATLLVFFLLGRSSQAAASWWLSVASLFFYAWWNPEVGEPWSPKYLGIILGSIVFNYVFGVGISRSRDVGNESRARGLLILGVAVNLAALGWFKYADFFSSSVNALLGTQWTPGHIALPLAISFFTFTQIAYLVDAWHGVTREFNFRWYLLFVSFFPHLIAGPIVLYRSLMPQFARKETWRFNAENFALGLTLFVFGMAKKVIIADPLSRVVGVVFSGAAESEPGLGTAWVGALAYTLQLYFDFSGYSDMAIGLGRMFNVAFPINFNSPYQARDIADFWRRWHISLSTFLRDHLYIPLGGNRKGPIRRHMNLFLTMLLGGLWHGAGWTFVLWGALHGMYLVVNHTWASAIKGQAWAHTVPLRISGRILTLLAIIVGWVVFRASSLDDATSILGGMIGLNGTGGPLPARTQELGLLVIAMVVALFAPNTNTIFQLAVPAKDNVSPPPRTWTLTPLRAAMAAVVFVAAILHMSRVSEFLYFQF